MKSIINVNQNLQQCHLFQIGNTALILEGFKTHHSKNFYQIDEGGQIACFVAGSVYAYDNSSLQVLTGKNVAEFITTEYKKRGFEFAKYLRGHFNIIIIDNDHVFLLNDKLGLLPMYMYQTNHGVFFCNEPDAIVWLGVDNKLDYAAMAKFLVYGFIPDGKTFIKGLYNQAPGTVLELCGRNLSTKKYCDMEPWNTVGMSNKEIVRTAHELIQEAVRIRIDENFKHVFLYLSGGWDSRFILANLMELDKKIVAITADYHAEDVIIAKKIVKKYNIKHITGLEIAPHSSSPRYYLDRVYGNKQDFDFYVNNEGSLKRRFAHLTPYNAILQPKFSGVFGGELLGYVPDSFSSRTRLNFIKSADEILSRKFLKEALKHNTHKELLNQIDKSCSPVFLFLNHLARTYLNVHSLSNWERPTKYFISQELMPFADSKLVSLLSALDYNGYMGYKLYEILFRKYYSDYLEFPWTQKNNRKRNDLKLDDFKKTSFCQDRNNYNDKGFIAFLEKQKFMKNEMSSLNRRKELFFLYNWLEVYKTVLDPSDVQTMFFGQ